MKLRTTELKIRYNTQKDKRGYFNKIYRIDGMLMLAKYYPKHQKGKCFKEINILENQIRPFS